MRHRAPSRLSLPNHGWGWWPSSLFTNRNSQAQQCPSLLPTQRQHIENSKYHLKAHLTSKLHVNKLECLSPWAKGRGSDNTCIAMSLIVLMPSFQKCGGRLEQFRFPLKETPSPVQWVIQYCSCIRTRQTSKDGLAMETQTLSGPWSQTAPWLFSSSIFNFCSLFCSSLQLWESNLWRGQKYALYQCWALELPDLIPLVDMVHWRNNNCGWRLDFIFCMCSNPWHSPQQATANLLSSAELGEFYWLRVGRPISQSGQSFSVGLSALSTSFTVTPVCPWKKH